jgi:hypothetical protein
VGCLPAAGRNAIRWRSRLGKAWQGKLNRAFFFEMKSWEIIADNLSKAGFSWGCVSAIDSNGRTIGIANAHCDDGKRFAVRAGEKLNAFLELESTVRA